MNDFHEGPENNSNNSINNNNPTPKKEPNTVLDLCIGLGISAITYVFIWLITIGKYPVTIVALLDLSILAVFGFLTIKFFRTKHTVAAWIMLGLISPGIFALLLMGACGLMFKL